MKSKLGEIKEVRLSSRLKESAACLVNDEWAMSAHVERLMRRMGREVPASKRILELNPGHPAVAAVQELFGVRVLKVRTQMRQGKKRRYRFRVGKMSDWKKAVVKLHGEDKIEFF